MENIKIYNSRYMHFCTSSCPLRDTNVLKCLTFRNRSRSWSITFAMRPVDGKYQNLQKSCIFVLALIISEILTFQIVDLQKVGQDHVLELSQCRPSDGEYQNL